MKSNLDGKLQCREEAGLVLGVDEQLNKTVHFVCIYVCVEVLYTRLCFLHV